MSCLIKITALCILIATVQCLEYEDDYSDDYPEERSFEEKAPIYDLKDAPKLFEKFIKDYDKEYKDKLDYSKHFNNFITNLKYINEVNREGKSSTSDINLFSDLGDDELSFLG
ncbi:jg17475 [Pararge aegeria aegeria]|uniref:Jg17475 protein n=1 Tax=Pararge aegeria aegeria TaxID=348720 RepID=A0A8S4RPJ4_9NEOP|nr:jg17475 [Pararge aegeria aegeria]